MLIGPVLVLAAMVSPEIRPSPPAPRRMAVFQPDSRVTARAAASVRILSGVRFGHDKDSEAAGATRRRVRLTELDGALSSAELLEFQ